MSRFGARLFGYDSMRIGSASDLPGFTEEFESLVAYAYRFVSYRVSASLFAPIFSFNNDCLQNLQIEFIRNAKDKFYFVLTGGGLIMNKNASKSTLGLVSVASFLINAAILTILLFGKNLLNISPEILLILVWIVPVALIVGIAAGIAAIITKRAWTGLVLNVLLITMTVVVSIWMFTFCCQPPPDLVR